MGNEFALLCSLEYTEMQVMIEMLLKASTTSTVQYFLTTSEK